MKKDPPGPCCCNSKYHERHTYHSRGQVGYVFYSCSGCGHEWTEATLTFDWQDPVSTDEVVDVVTWLESHDVTIADLVQPK